jgi:hypothetical protein
MNAPFSPKVTPDKREMRDRAQRTTTLLMTGKLIRTHREGLCRVRNISATGMKIETRAVLQVDQVVEIALRHGSKIPARVAWARDGAAGLAFLEPIDVNSRLAPSPGAQSRLSRQRAPRGPRLAAACAIEVEARGVTHRTALLDISQGGAKVRLPFHPLQDERLVLTIPGLPTKRAAVRWFQRAEAGVGFYEALPFDLLADWGEALEP